MRLTMILNSKSYSVFLDAPHGVLSTRPTVHRALACPNNIEVDRNLQVYGMTADRRLATADIPMNLLLTDSLSLAKSRQLL